MGLETSGPPTALLKDAKIVTSPRLIAEIQSDNFRDKSKDLNSKLPRSGDDPLKTLLGCMENWSHKNSRHEFSLRSVTVLETLNAIKLLGNSTAQANDKIDALAIKLAAKSLCTPINYIVNLSIQTKTFANKW